MAIVARNLSKRFKTHGAEIAAVAGVDLAVSPGETFGLIGPDGAGKTTLTRLLLGLLARSGGESSILGHDSMTDPYSIREQVGYVAQRFALPADMTVIENLRFFANVQGVSGADQRRRIPALLEFAGLTAHTGRMAGQLSGGTKKKLALACSLIHEPRLVLLDEPTLGVDPVTRREFWNLLGDLRTERGLTIFVCTTYMDEAERCHRVGLMYSGRMIICDTPAAVKAVLPGRMLEFTPSQFVPAQQLVTSLPGVLELQAYGSTLRVFVDEPTLRRPQIEAALMAQGITCADMRELAPGMEEAFISLMTREASRANEH